MWGYIVFACLFVDTFVFPSQGQSFCVKTYITSYFEDPLMDFIHIWHDGRYRSKPWGKGHRLKIFIKKSKFFVLKFI